MLNHSVRGLVWNFVVYAMVELGNNLWVEQAVLNAAHESVKVGKIAVSSALLMNSASSVFMVCLSWELANEPAQMLYEPMGFLIFSVYIYTITVTAVTKARAQLESMYARRIGFANIEEG